jgi:ankyrin repeat protein
VQRPQNPICFTRDITSSEQEEAILIAKSRIGKQTNTVDAIHEAAIEGDVKMVRSLPQLGVNSNASRFDQKDLCSKTPISSVASSNREGDSWRTTMQLLYDGGCNINEQPEHDGETALCAASRIGSLEKLTWLLEHGGERALEIETKNLRPLHLAAREGHSEVIQKLLDNNAAVDATATLPEKPTALHLAADWGQVKAVEVLLKTADVNRTTAITLRTPLHVAIVGMEDTLGMRTKDTLGMRTKDTPRGLTWDCVAITRLILSAKANFLLEDFQSMTPLQYTANYDQADHAFALLLIAAEQKADYHVKRDLHHAFIIACQKKDSSVGKLIGATVGEEDAATIRKEMKALRRKRVFKKFIPWNGTKGPLIK